MRVLRVVACLVNVGRGRSVLLAVVFFNEPERALCKIGRNSDAVRSDVSDERVQSFVSDVYSFVKLLRNADRLVRSHIELVVGFLLQRTRCERRRGFCGADALFDFVDNVLSRTHFSGNSARFIAVYYFVFVAVYIVERRLENVCFGAFCTVLCKHGSDVPILFGFEFAYFVFAVDNHFERGGLNSSRRQSRFLARFDFARKYGRNLVAHKSVEHAARLLRIHEIHIDFARIFHSRTHGFRRYFVELDTHLVALNSEGVFEVPADCFAFAVRVGCEIDFFVFFDRLRKFFNRFFLVGRHDVLRFETVFYIDSQRSLRQIAHVPFRGKHGNVATQILLNGLCLGGGLDNDKLFHLFSFQHKL